MFNKTSALILILAALVAGCIPPGYEFSMTRPEARTLTSNHDEDLSVVFSFPASTILENKGDSYVAYNGISMKLVNHSSEPLRIDWNRVRFTDHRGQTDLAVMPRGTAPANCEGDKPPLIVAPGDTAWQTIIPCYAAREVEDWQISLFPRSSDAREISFSLLMPVSFGEREKNYEFGFAARQKAKQDPAAY